MPVQIKDLYNSLKSTKLFLDENDFRDQLNKNPKEVFGVISKQKSTSGLFLDYDDFSNVTGLKKKDLQPVSQTGGKVGTSEAPLVGEFPKGFEGLKPAKVQPVEYKEPVVGEDTMLTRKMERAQKQAISGTEVRLPAAPKAVAAERGMQRAIEPMVEKTEEVDETKGFFNAIDRGALQGQLADMMALGQMPKREDLKEIARINKQMASIPSTGAYERFNSAPDFKSSVKEFIKNPLEITSQLIGESLTAQLRHGYSRAIAGAGTGAALGSVVPGIGTAAGAGTGFVAGMGVAGYNLEMASSIMDSFREAGVDVTDEKSLQKAFDDPATLKKARDFANKRAVPITLFDMFSMGMGGKLLGKPAKTMLGKIGRAAGEVGVQTGLAGAGETTAQVVSGQKINPTAIFAEMIGEVGGGAPDIVVGTVIEKKKAGQPIKKDVVQLDIKPEELQDMLDISEAAGEITDVQAQEIKQEFDKIQQVKQAVPEQYRKNADIVEALEQKRELEAQKQGLDPVFARKIDEQIKALDTKIDNTIVAGEVEVEAQVPSVVSEETLNKYLSNYKRQLAERRKELVDQGVQDIEADEEIKNIRTRIKNTQDKIAKVGEVAPETAPQVPAAPEIETKKADIERRRQEELSALIPQQKQAKGKLDFSAAFSGWLGRDLYEKVFNALQKGETTVAGIKEPLIGEAKPYFEKGLIKSAEDVFKYVNGKDINAKYDVELAALGVGEVAPEAAPEVPAAPKVEDKKADIERRRQDELSKYPNLYKNAKTKEELQKVVKDWLDLDIFSQQDSTPNVRGALGTPGGFERGKELFLEERKQNIDDFNNRLNAKYDAELASLGVGEVAPEAAPEVPATAISQEIADLRAKEQAEYAAMDDPNDEVKRKEIYDKYDKLITPLLEKEKEVSAVKPINIKLTQESYKGLPISNIDGTGFHRTNINVESILKNGFVVPKQGKAKFGYGVYFTREPKETSFGKNMVSSDFSNLKMIDLTNDDILGKKFDEFNEVFSEKGSIDYEKLTQDLKSNGIDGVITDNEIVVFNPSKLKNIKEVKPEEYAVQKQAAGKVPVQPEARVGEEVAAGVPPTEPPTTTEEGKAEGEGEEELRKLAANVPDTGKVSEYLSKGTIEKYTGETPTSSQQRGVQELRIALEHGEKIIDKAKEIFGKDYVEKTLDFIEKSQVNTSNKALMYVSLENALGKEKLDFPDRANEITKQQALVYKASQAFARESSLALNYQKLRKVAQVGYDSSRITDNFFTSEELEGKQKIEEAIEASPDQVNKAAEEREVETEEKVYTEKELEQKVEEGVRSEVEKLFEQLPKESKSRAQKALNVLADLKKKLRSRTYDATLGIPVAIIDAGITTIENAIKLGISVENAIDLGIKKIKEKLKGKEWAKEDDFRKDMLEEFKAQKVDTKASSSPMTIKQSVKEALIKKGFGREVTIKGEKKTILDWKKLAGKAGTVEKIQENVESAMKDQGYSEKEISDMKDQYIQEYIDLRQSIIEKAQNELARRNKSKVSPKQKSAAKRLAELYTLGLFEEKKDEFDNVLNSALGTDVSVKAFDEAKKIAEAMESIYAATFNGVRLTDVSAKSALEKLEDNLRILLYEESKRRGNFALRAANLVRSYFDISQTMILNSLKNTIENPLSGLQQKLIDKLFLTIGKETTPELVKERRKLMKDIYKDMVINGGIGYGNVESQFVNRRHLDDYVNKLSDNKLYQGIASVVTGKAALNAMDAMFKAGLTEARFTSNLVRILTSPSNPNQMSKAEAIKFVSEKLTGQTLEEAKKTAQDIIKKINEDAGQELIKSTPEQINRFANDIVKAALEMNNTITSEQIMAAYNAAYKSAGLSVGHEANNMLSDMVRSHSAKLEGKINNSIKEKEWNNAALLTLRSIIFRNILNPFVGGGTNWLVLKFEKTGLGLFTGLAYEYSGRKDIDVTSKAGLEKLEKRLFNQSRAKDSYMRGLVGGLASMLTYAAFLGLADSEEYRRWRAKNKWAARYLDLITPEVLLAQMAIENKNFKQYVSTTLNKNDAFDATNKLIKSGEYGLKGEKAKALGALGEAVGSKLNAPLPWRLVRDGQIIYQGIKGEDPYHGNFKQSEGFWSGALQGGAIEWLGFRPMSKGLDVALFTITDPVSGEKREVTEAERLKVKNEMVKIYNELLRDYKSDYNDIWLDLSGKVRISTRGIKDAEIDTWKSKTYKQLNKEQQEQLDDKIKEKALNSAKKILSE